MIYEVGGASPFSSDGHPNFFVAVVFQPIELATGNTVTLGYWNAHEDISITLGGVQRTLQKTMGALVAEDPQFLEGTEITTQRVQLFGLGQQARSTLNSYDFRGQPMECWHLVFNQGGENDDRGRFFKGVVGQKPLKISGKGQTSTLDIIGQSSSRQGTKTSTAKKSDVSYQLRNGDTSMEQSSLKDTESDTWTGG